MFYLAVYPVLGMCNGSSGSRVTRRPSQECLELGPVLDIGIRENMFLPAWLLALDCPIKYLMITEK